MGRARKPLSEQKGGLTRERQVRRETEQNMAKTGSDCLAVPPEWLINETAVKEYRRIVRELKDLELVGNLDINALGNYCNAFAKYLEVTEKLRDAPLTIINAAGNEVENPLVGLQLKYSKEMRDNGRLCGLTIDSRLKFSAHKLNVIEDEINDKFGDI